MSKQQRLCTGQIIQAVVMSVLVVLCCALCVAVSADNDCQESMESNTKLMESMQNMMKQMDNMKVHVHAFTTV